MNYYIRMTVSCRRFPLFPSFHKDTSIMKLNNLPRDAGSGVKETVFGRSIKQPGNIF